ncbi:MAG: MalY/PatB family protein [Succinivibrio sp.]|nr:MalY/PatB family protein [Succinivibrio sp.]
MLEFDFDTVIPRRGSGAAKWDECPEGVIPLWIADMDFKAAPCVQKAVAARAAHGIFGYEKIGKRWYEAIGAWQSIRNGVIVKPSETEPVPGIVPAVSAVLQALTLPGDQIVVQTPCYNLFYSCIRNSGCEFAENPLIFKDGRYEIDFDDLERKLAAPRARALLLCNPHNPTGRLWTRGEITRIAELARKHGVIVLSDEIHSDVRPEGSAFTSFAALPPEFSQHAVVFNAPSKAFNLAGLQDAYIIIRDPALFERIDRQVNINEICDLNPFGVRALIAAYEEGRPWLAALNAYLRENLAQAGKFFNSELPGIKFALPEATYLMWLDFRAFGKSSDELWELFVKNGVMLSKGTIYGAKSDGFMRLNAACPRPLLMQGLERIAKALR